MLNGEKMRAFIQVIGKIKNKLGTVREFSGKVQIRIRNHHELAANRNGNTLLNNVDVLKHLRKMGFSEIDSMSDIKMPKDKSRNHLDYNRLSRVGIHIPA